MSGCKAPLAHRARALCCLSAMLVAGCSGGSLPGDGSSHDGYTPLDFINESNAEPLSVAWAYDAEAPFAVAPVVADGVVYADAGGLGVHAVAAGTGQKLWHFDAKVPEAARQQTDGIEEGGSERWSRGVVLSQGRVYFTARDGRLIALDAATGVPAWEADGTGGNRSAPRVAGERIIVATAGAEGVAGRLTAFESSTGKVAWDIAEPAGTAGVSSLGSMTYDPDSRLLYVSAGGERPSLRGIDPKTGGAVWQYFIPQTEGHADVAGGDLVLADLTIADVARKVVMQARSDGRFHVLDRADGKEISVTRYVKSGGAHLEHPPSYNPKVGLVYLAVEADGKRYLQAWNPVSAKEQWRIVLDESAPCGGLLSTAGNLVIQGDSEGYLNVFEAEYGEVRARAVIDACATGAPFSYAVDKVQYIGALAPAAAAGASGGRILALKLGGAETRALRDMKRYPRTIRPEES